MPASILWPVDRLARCFYWRGKKKREKKASWLHRIYGQCTMLHSWQENIGFEVQRILVRIKRIIIPHAQTERAVRYFSLLSNRVSCKHAELTLIRQEVQHGLQEEGQVADGQTRVAHATRSINKLVEEAYLYSSPASVDTWKRER